MIRIDSRTVELTHGERSVYAWFEWTINQGLSSAEAVAHMVRRSNPTSPMGRVLAQPDFRAWLLGEPAAEPETARKYRTHAQWRTRSGRRLAGSRSMKPKHCWSKKQWRAGRI